MSRPRFVLTPQARADLVEIWNYIAEDSLENADRVLDGCMPPLRAWPRRPAWAIIGKTWRIGGTASRRFTLTSSPTAIRPGRSKSSPSFMELASWRLSSRDQDKTGAETNLLPGQRRRLLS